MFKSFFFRIIFSFTLVFSSLGIFAQTPPPLTAVSAVLMDFHTGRILFQRDGDIPFPPASMTKLITLYLCYQAIEEGSLDKNEIIEVTPEGSSFSRPPRSSIMMLEEGQQVDILTLMRGVAVSSGNDAAYQLAQLVAGNADTFVMRMNGLMQELGYDHMSFVDPDGWSEHNQVTAMEYARFSADYISHFPQALEELHSVPQLAYPQPSNFAGPEARIRWTRTKNNTNALLGVVPGVDGLKTGYIDESGFNFAATAKRDDTRLITVVMGIFTDSYAQGIARRAQETTALLEWGFENWTTQEAPVPSLSIPIWMARQEEVSLKVDAPPLFTLSQEEMESLVILNRIGDPLKAPVQQGEEAGIIQWYLDGQLLGESPLVTTDGVERGPFFQRLIDFFPMIFYKCTHGRM